jgi:hypothetical protein
VQELLLDGIGFDRVNCDRFEFAKKYGMFTVFKLPMKKLLMVL